MAWLILDYAVNNEIEEFPQTDGTMTVMPRGSQTSQMTIIETTKGMVTELEYRILGGTVKERKPTLGEVERASRELGKDKPQLEGRVQELEGQLAIVNKKLENEVRKRQAHEKIEKNLREELNAFEDSVVYTSHENDLLAAALDHFSRIIADENSATYMALSELHKKITGIFLSDLHLQD